MFIKRLSFISGGVIGSTIIYFSLNKHYNLKQNIYLETKSEQNKSPSNEHKQKKKVVIIGGGVMGIASAYFLLESQKYDVTLIEKNENVSQETSYKNGCIFCPCLCEPWINQYVPKYFFKALFYPDFSIGISWKCLRDTFVSIWILNMLPNIIPRKVDSNREKLHKLGQVSQNELNKLFDNNILDRDKVESHIQGNFSLFDKKESIGYGSYERKLKQGFKAEILENEAIYEKEKCLKSSNVNKYSAGVLIYGDTNLNVYKFDMELLKYLNNKYPENFKVLTNTSHKKFILEKNTNKIIGIETNKGKIFSDYYVVAAGNYTKSILKSLGVRVPIIPVKGHALSVPADISNPRLLYNVTNDSTKNYLTQISTIYRLSGGADFEGMDFEIKEKRTSQLKAFLLDMISGKPDLEKAEGWCCLRPVSADDVPIVSKVKNFENLFMNAGHGSKGLTLALGSGKLLVDLIENRKGELEEKDYELNRFYFV